ncbi:hypothetical protein JOD62_000480 [Microbacterium keratanolyticum]|uniref:Uncharacterized protein n=1 Tax=Microbacterium keratanolyticum TaxID=67574 RepID=A0A9W6HTY6_9MICO|nr:hypothetical protein [Microbacterium keratanolyticum]MBM7467932.1 hypothetical protein [Microbacterium keratanolyticum]GLK02923.1 hypothetical protein GCM10017596_26380 [Microbacterium keratanolyticum]
MSARARAVRQIGVMSLAVLLLAACTPVDRESGSKSASPRSASADTAERTSLTQELPLPTTVVCNGHGFLDVTFEVDALLDPRPATELGPAAAAAVTRQDLGPNAKGVAFETLPEDWIIGEERADRVVLLRPQSSETVQYITLPADYEMRLFLIDPVKPVDASQWYPTFENTCAFELPLREDADNPVIALAADNSPEDSFIDIWVSDMTCRSGLSAEGRIEIVRLREFDDRIELAVAVAPPSDQPAAATCQGVAPTRYRVELAAALGERTVIDLSRIPAQRVPILVTRDVG